MFSPQKTSKLAKFPKHSGVLSKTLKPIHMRQRGKQVDE